MPTCVFCGSDGSMTGEHVFPDWLSEIGLPLDPTLHMSGPINRTGRDLGVRPPFRQKVRDVCEGCNSGWMSQLEDHAKRALTPLILGDSAPVPTDEHASLTSWAQKTALVALLVSSDDDRDGGYGVPRSEYHEMYVSGVEAQPLPNSQAWIGRYHGVRLGSAWTVPLTLKVGDRDPELPQGYVSTVVVGAMLIQVVRWIEIQPPAVSSRRRLPRLWPSSGEISQLGGDVISEVDFRPFARGEGLVARGRFHEIRPWAPAIDLERSGSVRGMVDLPTICGFHSVFYPEFLALEGLRGARHAFQSACECPTAYLFETGPEGVVCRASGTPEAIEQRYESVVGSEEMFVSSDGVFFYKRLG